MTRTCLACDAWEKLRAKPAVALENASREAGLVILPTGRRLPRVHSAGANPGCQEKQHFKIKN